MKKEWSPKWLSSTQTRKQRKFRHNAPLHVRQKFVSAHLSKELRERFGRRSMQVRKGDEIRVLRGGLKGKTGAVESVDLSKGRVYVDEIKVKKVDGSEVPRGLEPSNLLLTKLKIDDKRRQAILDRSEQAKRPRVREAPQEKARPEKAEPEAKAEKRPEPKGPEKRPARKPLGKAKKPVKKAPGKNAPRKPPMKRRARK